MCPTPRQSIYRVWIEECPQFWMGTAFAVKAPNLVVTAGHVVEGKNLKAARLMSSVFRNRFFRFRKVAEDGEADLALLKLEERDPDFLPLAISTGPTAYGQHVWAVGYPMTHYGAQQIRLEQSERHLALCSCTVVAGPNADDASRSFLFVHPQLSGGMSGSPILDHEDKVVGVFVAQVGRLRFWISPPQDSLSKCIWSSRIDRLLGKVEKRDVEPEPEPEAAPARNMRRWLRFFHWG